MRKPVVFIGSSTEGDKIAYAIQENLENDCDIYVWTQGVFELGSSYLESLINELDKADFAILVLTEDDITISRNQQTVSPRDNVLFELGLFMGRLGRNRSFFVYDKNKNIKIPSDLSGISGAAFTMQQSGNLKASLGAACNKIRNSLVKTGLRVMIDAAEINTYNKRLDFCNKITGFWWERIKPDTASALSFVDIQYDKETAMLKMKGRSFDQEGNYIAYWESKSAGIHFKEQKVFYHWEGWFPSKPSEKFEGVGEISFYSLTDVFMEGNGIFSNINTVDTKSLYKSSFEFSRSNTEEEAIMYSKDKERIAQLIKAKISKMF
jgi:hypothetical protein